MKVDHGAAATAMSAAGLWDKVHIGEIRRMPFYNPVPDLAREAV